jgi:hypothetical protein
MLGLTHGKSANKYSWPFHLLKNEIQSFKKPTCVKNGDTDTQMIPTKFPSFADHLPWGCTRNKVVQFIMITVIILFSWLLSLFWWWTIFITLDVNIQNAYYLSMVWTADFFTTTQLFTKPYSELRSIIYRKGNSSTSLYRNTKY